MRIVADLHIHSHYSRATSPKLKLTHLDRWARIKGIDLVGTGDCTHPAWLAELSEQLEPSGEGFFRLKAQVRHVFDLGEALAEGLPDPPRGGLPARTSDEIFAAERRPSDEPMFVLSGEISTIYSAGGRTRKVHHVVLLPDFAAATAFQAKLESLGSISSDGRPILGIDSRDLFALLLEADERSILVPAHIWTPWFSVLGARSGFDSIDECYRDLAPRIGAVETGLSSNPPMNWAVSALDRFSIISNSDAHSPEKLGREATVIDIEPSFAGLAEALGGGGPRGRLIATVEFFPQEGKYHYDGHRACGVAFSPEESAALGGLCPVCGKPLTPGVMRRVMELADRPVDESAPCPEDWAGTNRRPYRSLIPLKELVAELLGAGEGSKKVTAAYTTLLERGGSEFGLLLDHTESELEKLGGGEISGELLAETVGRIREGRVSVVPGYDGEYGRVSVFSPGEDFKKRDAEADLFADSGESAPVGRDCEVRPAGADEGAPRARERARVWRPVPSIHDTTPISQPVVPKGEETGSAFALDPAQLRAVRHRGGPLLVAAGPGTGKTTVLGLRIARMVEEGTAPSSIVAVTFTTRAAEELRGRIGRALGRERAAEIWTGTFHALCRSILREHHDEAGLSASFGILDDELRSGILEKLAPASTTPGKLGDYIEGRKRFLLLPGETHPRLGPEAPAGLDGLAIEFGIPSFDAAQDTAYAEYRRWLKLEGLLDFDDLVAGAVRLLAADPTVLSSYRRRFRALFVDEYQDVNFAQFALVRLLAPDSSAELCVIGDPNQAIYGFRGSDRRFMDRFLTDYPGAASYRLRRSFRCAPGIIGAAGRLVGTELAGSGSAVTLVRSEFPTEKSEAEGIAREIDRLIGGTRFFAYDSGVVDSTGDSSPPAASASRAAEFPGRASGGGPVLRSLGECAILLRAASLAPPIEKALLDHGIPYRLIGEVPWWKEEPARSALSLLRAAIRPVRASDASIMNVSVNRVGAAAKGRKGARSGSPDKEDILRALLPGMSAEAAVRASMELIEKPPQTVGGRTVEENAPKGSEGAARLLARAARYRSLEQFLDDLSVGSAQDGLEARTERVSLMTIHAAKGLEFDHVFIAALEEGILPLTLFAGRAAEIDEERRLLYVAMTRARIGLHLSWARSRRLRGRPLALSPSRFLSELEDLIPLLDAAPRRRRDPQLGLF